MEKYTKTLSYLFVIVFLLFAYQNCTQPLAPIEGVNVYSNCGGSELLSLESSSAGGNSYLFHLGGVPSNLNITRYEWYQNYSKIRTTTAPNVDLSLPSNGDVTISVLGYSSCDDPVVSGSTDLSLGSCGQERIQLEASQNTLFVGETANLEIQNVSSINNNTIVWYVDGIQINNNGNTVYEFQRNTVGEYKIKVKAHNLSCDGNIFSEELTIVVSEAEDPQVALVDFDATNKIGSYNGGVDTVYKIRRNETKKISFDIVNAEQVDYDETASSNCKFDDCYKINLGTSSSQCIYKEKTLSISNGSDSKEEIFFYHCPQGQSYCHVGLKRNKTNDQSCIDTSVVLNASPSECTIAGSGSSCSSELSVSDIQDLESGHVLRIHSKSTSDDNYDLAPIACGTSNLLVTVDSINLEGLDFQVFVDTNASCQAYASQGEFSEEAYPVGDSILVKAKCAQGYHVEGDQCVPSSSGYCPSETISGCNLPQTAAGGLGRGDCTGGGQSCCYAMCGSNGNWGSVFSRCPSAGPYCSEER